METTAPVQVSMDALKEAVKLARSAHLFLSIYLPTNPAELTTEGIRLQLTSSLDEILGHLAETPWEAPFQEERKVVEEYIRSLRPGGRGLVILSSKDAQKWEAMWLPGAVEEHIRFGRGAYVLPLIDALDEGEPVGLAMVARDQARLMVLSAGRIEEARHLEAETSDRDTTPGRVSPRLQRSGFAREAGGGGAARFQRHLQAHLDNHLEQVAQELDSLYRHHGFRRFFVAGPTETVALFKPHLSREMRERLVGELSISAHATDNDIRTRVLQELQEVERKQELELVQEVVTRAEKDQGAVVELAPSLWALNRGQVHLLVLAGETSESGVCCMSCELLLPPEHIACPQCGEKTVRVDLWEELPGFALRRHIQLEIVHGEAASLLWRYDGIGALLEPTPH